MTRAFVNVVKHVLMYFCLLSITAPISAANAEINTSVFVRHGSVPFTINFCYCVLNGRRFVVVLPSRCQGPRPGTSNTSATAKLPVRYRGYTRYRGLRYRGLFVFYPEITKKSDA